MSKRPHISNELAREVARLIRAGDKTRPEIAQQLGISITSVHRISRSMSGDVPSSRRGRSKSDKWRYCDHPRTPENTTSSGGKWETCRTCKRQRDRDRFFTGVGKGNGEHPQRFRPITRDVLSHIAPRPLPVVDTSGRSYSLFPRKFA